MFPHVGFLISVFLISDHLQKWHFAMFEGNRQDQSVDIQRICTFISENKYRTTIFYRIKRFLIIKNKNNKIYHQILKVSFKKIFCIIF